MSATPLTAFYHGPLLLVFWRQDGAPTRDFQIVLNQCTVLPKPYLGIPIGAERQHALFIALADATLATNKVSVALISTTHAAKLASMRKAQLPALRAQDLAALSLEQRRRLGKTLTKGLRATFPALDAALLTSLQHLVTPEETTPPNPPPVPPILADDTRRLDERHVLGWLALSGAALPDPGRVRACHVESGAIGTVRRLLRLGRTEQDGALVLFAFAEPLAAAAMLRIECQHEDCWLPAQTLTLRDDLPHWLTTLGSGAELALPLWELIRDTQQPAPVALAVGLEAGRRKALADLRRVGQIQGKGRKPPFLLNLEQCGVLPGAGLFLSGFLLAAPERMRRLVLHHPSGSYDLTAYLNRTVRRDLARLNDWIGDPARDRPGLECFVPLAGEYKPAMLETGYLAAELDDATVVRIGLRPVLDLSARDVLLETRQALELLEGFGPLLDRHTRHALRPLQTLLGDWLRQTQNRLQIQQGTAATDMVCVHFDYVQALPEQQLYLCGWLADPQRQLLDIHLFTAFGDAVDLTGRIPNAARPDVLQNLRQQGIATGNEFVGFHLRLDIPLPQGADTPFFLRVRLRDGGVHRLALRARAYDPEQVLPLIRQLLGSFPTWEPQLFEFYDRALGPAIARLWAHRARPTLEVRQESFGIIPVRPRVSIIVPLYGRVDLLSFQLAQFADDADFQHCELIYVLDDPTLHSAFIALCRQEYPLFRLPFRTLISGANLGYAGATNLGAAQARGEYLLLLNSDVLPRQPGWLSHMVRIFESLNRPGVLGPKLLFPDGLIQHAGMCFFQEPTLPGFWFNDHPEKGLPNDTTLDIQTRQTVAVTGACMLLRRVVYQEVAGLSEDYILGDFEDSDLCLKLRGAGYRIWYTPQVELYHLERLSFPYAGDAGWRTNLSRYNAWVQTRRWAKTIQAITPTGSD